MDPIEADNNYEESAYGDDISSYTASVTSTALNFPSRDGRRYHGYKEGKYFLPNDDKENGRLEIVAQIMRLILKNELTLAPIKPDIGRAIDLGTGTGMWAIEFADAHESTEVIGNDLSPIQPSWAPPNVKFIVDDIEEEWPYAAEPFDYVHARHLAGSIRDWPKLLRQAFTCTKPGGWVEIHDLDLALYTQDGSLPEDAPLQQWSNYVVNGLRKIGAEPRPGPQLEEWMKAAGFVDTKVLKQAVPLGPWAKSKELKQMGVLNYMQIMEGLEGISLGTMKVVNENFTVEEIKAFLEDVRKDVHNPSIHALYDFWQVYGQKPAAATTSP